MILCSIVFCKGQECRFKLEGHIHSSAAHEDLSNASIYLVEQMKSVIADSKGYFVFDDLCPGTYTLKISHVDYDTMIKRVNLRGSAHVDANMIQHSRTLSNIDISSVRGLPNTGLKKQLLARDLEQMQGFSFAEAVAKLNGVTLLQTGSNISKPVIHGLNGNRILTINNGVRQEGQQWGSEHAPEIDSYIAGNISVIKGVDELKYGSDAIGGVILVEPKSLRACAGYNAEFNAMHATNNRQWVASGIFEQQLKNLKSFTYRLQGTIKTAANARTPEYGLNNTGSREKNFSVTAAWRREHFNSELYYSFFDSRVGIFAGSHVGNLNDLRNAIAAPRPDPTFTEQQTYDILRPSQSVRHSLAKWKSSATINNNKYSLLVAGQVNKRKEFDIVRSSGNKAPQIDLSISTLTEELNWEHRSGHNFSGTAGLAAMQQNNSYTGRYLIPNYKLYSYGAFYIEKWTVKKLNVEAGLRYDKKDINTNRLQSNGATFNNYNFHFATFAASLNAGFKISEYWKINSNISLSGRPPHVNELLTNGVHHGNGTYESGDINLRPERAFNVIVNSSYKSKSNIISLDASLYSNSFHRFIFQQPKPDEPVLTISGAFPKIQYKATDAILNGLDLTAVLLLYKRLSLSNKLSFLRARNKAIDDWLIGMPADRVESQLTYDLKSGRKIFDSYFSAGIRNVFKQTRVPGNKYGEQDYKAPPGGYVIVDADMSTSFKIRTTAITLGISGRNLLNKAYRDYLNSFRYFTDETGRNISIRLKVALNHSY